MKPDVQRERLELFFSQSVSDCEFSTGSVFYQPGFGGPLQSDEFDDHFMNLLHAPATQPAFSNLNETQFELCFRELLERPELFESGRHGATVGAYYSIKTWNIKGVDVVADSALGMYFGAKPVIIPRFSFETLDIFEYLREVLEEVRLCKLNPKHIKGRKS